MNCVPFRIVAALGVWCACLASDAPLPTNASRLTVVFEVPLEELKARIQATATNVSGVVGVPQTPFRWTAIDLSRSGDRIAAGSVVSRERLRSLEVVQVELLWMPPPKPPAPVSRGGESAPLPSKVVILAGRLRGRTNHSFCYIDREWKYREGLHLPYTEIPAGRALHRRSLLLDSDCSWAAELGRGAAGIGTAFTNKGFFEAEVLDCLDRGRTQ